MIKGTIKRASWTAFAVLALGCGGRAENQGSASAGGSDAASGAPSIAVAGSSAAGAPSIGMGFSGSSAGGTPGVGPFDATGLPTQLPTDCPGMPPPPQLALPCKVGGSLNGGADGPGSYNVLECYTLANETAAQDRPALAMIIPFGNLPTMLNQPLQLASLIPAPGGGVKLTGTVLFTQVDPVGRAFVGRLIGGAVDGCAVPDTPFWAVKGDFT